MSIHVSSLVWKYGPGERTQRFVLLSIADNANEDGFAYPLMATIAERCVMTTRTVISTIAALVRDGWIEVVDHPKNHKANAYQINLNRLSSEKSSHEKISCEKSSCEIHGASHVKSTAMSCEIHCNPPHPLLGRTVIEQSIELSAKPFSDEAVETPRDAVRDVFSYYLQKFKRNPRLYLLTEPRMEIGLRRLRDAKKVVGPDGDPVGLMKLAVDNLAKSKWHSGENPDGKKYQDWESHLFKSFERMEKWYRGDN